MTKLTMTRGGTVIPADKTEEWLNEDGNKHPEETKEPSKYSQLNPYEKSAVNNFLKKHPNLCTLDGIPSTARRRIFQERASEQLLQTREEIAKRKEENKPSLTAKEKELVLVKDGVIRTVWYHNELVRDKEGQERGAEEIARETYHAGRD